MALDLANAPFLNGGSSTYLCAVVSNAFMADIPKLHSFQTVVSQKIVPPDLPSPFLCTPPELAQMAAKQLQEYLKTQTEWQHNFGLGRHLEGKEIGKMFGVLAVQSTQDDIGFLAAFSGKLAGGNHHSYFVPPVYDSLKEDGFLNQGMLKLSGMSKEIKTLQAEAKLDVNAIKELKLRRKATSVGLQGELFDNYHFLNAKGETQTPWDIFKYDTDKMPPSGVGECAAPKLFQYAFQNNLKPLAIAEFWWGKPTKSENQKHIQYYPACKEKCGPLLKYMLDGV